MDSTAYQAAAKPYRQIRIFAMLLLAVGIVGMEMILYLVLRLWVKGREHEVGILFSAGIKKGEIWGQMLVESLIVSAVALTLATLLSGPLIGKCVAAAEHMAMPKDGTEAYEVMVTDLSEPVVTKTASDEVVLDHKVSVETMFFTILLVCGISSISVILSFFRISSLEPKRLLQLM